jgi:anthranilate phosphoribosyltransferase
MADRMIGVLERLGSEYAFVYHGSDGLDEITTTGPTYIDRLKDGETTTAEFTPEDFGVPRATTEDLLGGDVTVNVAIVKAILAGEKGPKRDAAIVNAAPGLVVAGIAEGFVEATSVAAEAIDSGAAADVLDRVVRRSNEFAG